MLTRLQVKNFKRFDDVDIELGQTVVFIGPNNSGKSTALQALALWETGLRRWKEKWGKSNYFTMDNVIINRNDLVATPIPDSELIWRNRRAVEQKAKNKVEIFPIQITVFGMTNGKIWECGLRFDYANQESLFCAPLFEKIADLSQQRVIPEMGDIRVALLPPMSGLASYEPRLDPGAINVRIGEGRTAEVLRNICHRIYEDNKPGWQKLANHIDQLFGVKLAPPVYVSARGEITMTYQEKTGVKLDLSCSGRGMQQILLLLAYLYANPGAVLLLDEPDAHLEILRQRQIYNIITQIALEQNCQIIAASHSEILLNEAANRDMVVAFVGKPHRIDGRGSQVLKALRQIGFDQYYQAEQTGWVLYLEGATDLAILRAFAQKLNHPACECLEKPFVHYVLNAPNKAEEHFFGLQEAKKDLIGIAIFDRIDKDLKNDRGLTEMMWNKRELENYLTMPEVLIAYSKHDLPNDLIGAAEANSREQIMKEAINEIAKAMATLEKGDPWSADIKATDDFLDPLFKKYFGILKLPNLLNKTDYHVLASLVPRNKISDEITEKLDAILEVAKKAKPREN